MLSQSLLVLAVSLGAPALALSSTFCLKGCCGLQLELPSQMLSFSNPTEKSSQAAITIQHTSSGIQCCECTEEAEIAHINDDVPSKNQTPPIFASK
jgi:hypothetical protein